MSVSWGIALLRAGGVDLQWGEQLTGAEFADHISPARSASGSANSIAH
jgi:hypothetical protein